MGDSYGAVMVDSRPLSRTASGRWSWCRTAIAACTLIVLATACVDIEMDIVVREDGSGSVSTTMRIGESVMEFAALGDGSSPEDFCQRAADEAGFDDALVFDIAGVDESFESAIENGTCVITTVSSWTADESEAVLEEMASVEGDGLSRLEGGGWRFELDMGTFKEEAESEDLSQITALGFDPPTLTITVTLPGNAVEHNAQSVSQSKYTWEVPFDAIDELPPSLYVETAPGSGGLGPEAIGAIIAGVLLALAALVTLRRHQEAKAAASSVDDAESTTASDDPTASEPSGGDDDLDAEDEASRDGDGKVGVGDDHDVDDDDRTP